MAAGYGRREAVWPGAVLGALAAAGLIGWLYLAHAWLRLPFVPFDIADAIIRLAPGRLATAGIEALGEWAKRALLALGLLLMLAAGAGLGVLAAWLAPAARPTAGGTPRSERRLTAGRAWRQAAPVALPTLLALLATWLIEAVVDWNQAPAGASLVGLALSYSIWAWAVSAGCAVLGRADGASTERRDGPTIERRSGLQPDAGGGPNVVGPQARPTNAPQSFQGDAAPASPGAGAAANVVGLQARPTKEPPNKPQSFRGMAPARLGRRSFLLRFAAAGLGTALTGATLGEVLRVAAARRSAASLPLPTTTPYPGGSAPPQTALAAGGPLPATARSPARAAALVEPTGTGGPTQVPAAAGTPADASAETGEAPASDGAATYGAGTGAGSPAPTPALAPAAPPPGTPLPVFVPAPGTRPNLTPLPDFYVVNIATRDPLSDLGQWRLAVRGLVDRPLSLAYADLLRLPRVDVPATLECISNPLGGPLIGTAQFNGARLKDVLAQAGVQRGVVEVVTRSLDGYSESIPLDKALDANTLLVYGMDGLTLQQQHGYPLRLYNPNHYGMKNPKWLQALELAPAPYTGYWEVRGWDQEAVVKTTAVLDTRGQLPIVNGVVALGGIAFAGWRGIQAVGVQIDHGGWRDAVLDRPASSLTWVRWRYDWRDATPGPHDIVVRAIDGNGEEQSNFVTPPHPDGASGWQKTHVIVG